MILTSRIAAACILLFLIIAMTYVPIPEAQAGEGEAEETSVVQTYYVVGGLGGFLIMLIGLALIVPIPVAALMAKRENSWPHWRRLVRGLGEAAFRLGILGFASGMIVAALLIAEMGASATARRFWMGFAQALTPVFLGSLVGLVGMLGSAILRALSPVARPS